MEKDKLEEIINNVQQAYEGENLIKTSFENLMAYLNTKEMPDRIIESIGELLTDKKLGRIERPVSRKLGIRNRGNERQNNRKICHKSRKRKTSHQQAVQNLQLLEQTPLMN